MRALDRETPNPYPDYPFRKAISLYHNQNGPTTGTAFPYTTSHRIRLG
jgi:hypothetical protein